MTQDEGHFFGISDFNYGSSHAVSRNDWTGAYDNKCVGSTRRCGIRHVPRQVLMRVQPGHHSPALWFVCCGCSAPTHTTYSYQVNGASELMEVCRLPC